VKKLFIIFLAACFLFELGGYFFVYRLNRSRIRSEVRSYLKIHKDRFNQVVFAIPLINGEPAGKDFIWEDRYEFAYRNNMYDVVEMKTTRDTLYVRCVKDEKENNFLHAFWKIMQENQGKHSSKNNNQALIQLLSTPYMLFTETVIPVQPRDGCRIFFPEEEKAKRHTASEVPTPPPQSFI